MFSIQDQPVLSVIMRETTSSIDRSLQTIKDFLIVRAQSVEDEQFQLRLQQTSFDVGTFGLQKEEEALAPPVWTGIAVCPIRLYHSLLVLGPLYRPDQMAGPCPRCLELRWFAMRSKEEQQALLCLQEKAVVGHNPRLTSFALETLWSAVTILFRGQNPFAELTVSHDQFYLIDLETLAIESYQLIAESFCPVCALPRKDTAEDAIINLAPRLKPGIEEYRLVQPLAYDLPEAGYINPVCGMLGLTTIEEYLHTVTSPVSGKFSVKTPFSVYDTWWGGHGNSYQMSRRLGLLEGLERYSGHRVRAKTVSVYDSYTRLKEYAMNPIECGLYEDEFYRRMAPYYKPYSPDENIYWVWGYSFRQQRSLLVPEQLAYYMHHRKDDLHFIQDCSNGCATGSSIEEAILYGLLELVERDGFLMSWYARLSPRRIDPWSCKSRSTLNILDRIYRQGYDVYLLDTRMDIRIPSVTAIGILREEGLGSMLLAAGCSLEPEDAVRSALCEVAAYIPSFRDRLQKNLALVQEMARDYTKVTALQHHPLAYGLRETAQKAAFLYANPDVSPINERYRDWLQQRPQTYDLRDDLQHCLEDIFRLGMDVIVVDQTSPELENVGLKAASVIIPGLIPIDFGWGRNRAKQLPRMRTVPRLAGYQTDDFDPAFSNIMPHPFP